MYIRGLRRVGISLLASSPYCPKRTLMMTSQSASEFLTDSSLLRDLAFIDGKWVQAETEATYAVEDPATNVVIAQVPAMQAKDCRVAIDAAERAWGPWKKRTAKERGDLLRKWYDLMVANSADLAKILTLENGKPLTEAKGEVAYGASFVEFYAEEAKRMYGEVIPSPVPGRRLLAIKQPVGVCGLITPWNFPNAMITRKAAPALAAGCTVVIKPAEDTPLSALALCELAHRAGIPPGVINVVTCPREFASAMGTELCTNPKVRKVSFTGSTRVGKVLMRESASHVKRLSLELGGNAPLIVFDDADLDLAVTECINGKFRNAGQTCVAPNRMFVQAGIHDKFVELLSKKVAELQVGHGLQPGVQQGPLINVAGLEKVQAHVEDAVKKGAQVRVGGDVHSLGGTFFQPTVLEGCGTDMLVFADETFGPICSIFRFKEDEKAVALANNTPYGLAAYIFTRDLSRAFWVSEAIEAGMVAVNEGILSTSVAPFGGVKESGLGREGGHQGLAEYVNTKYLCMGRIKE